MSDATSARVNSEGSDSGFRPDVTVATLVLRDGRFLTVEEDVRGDVVLNQPAGHLEPDESLCEAAVRETLEETGWTVALSHYVGTYRWVSPHDGRTFLRFVFAAKAQRHDAARPLDAGILRTLWLTPGELREATPRLRSPLVLAAVEDYLAGARFPLRALRDV